MGRSGKTHKSNPVILSILVGEERIQSITDFICISLLKFTAFFMHVLTDTAAVKEERLNLERNVKKVTNQEGNILRMKPRQRKTAMQRL